MTRKISIFDNTDTRGVSPVIGVILMVAITVILAAVIGTFVLGIGQNVSQKTPQAQLTMKVVSGTSNLTIEHKGGDAIPLDSIKVTVTNSNNNVVMSFTSSNTSELTVGDTGVINTSTKSVSWPSSVNSSELTFTSNGSLTNGDTYTVKIIDTQSQQLIASQKVRA